MKLYAMQDVNLLGHASTVTTKKFYRSNVAPLTMPKKQ